MNSRITTGQWLGFSQERYLTLDTEYKVNFISLCFAKNKRLWRVKSNCLIFHRIIFNLIT